MRLINRNDIGKMGTKIIHDSVVVPDGLRVNCFTMKAHQDYNAFMGVKLLTEVEARLVGHREEEIREWFR
jgi:hypothetical protein